MKIRGNLSPELIHIEPFAPKPGCVEIRLRDNIKPVTEKDEMTGQAVQMFEYDEFTFVLPDREGLREDVEANMADWLATGRTSEVNVNASLVKDYEEEAQNMKEALAELGVTEDD